MIEIYPIKDDVGNAVCYGDLRVDVFPKDETEDAFISITEPRMSISDARKFAMLLIAAAEFSEKAG